MKNESPGIGIIGGSGLYEMEEVRGATESDRDPVRAPSDTLIGGKVGGRQVYFLPRHGRGHRILPHELNHRANIYALRSLNVRWIISVGAVGSLQEKYAPRDYCCLRNFTIAQAGAQPTRSSAKALLRISRSLSLSARSCGICSPNQPGLSASQSTTAALM